MKVEFRYRSVLPHPPGRRDLTVNPEEDTWREPFLAAARSMLGEEVWEEALAEGRAMALERAVAYALGEGVA